MLKAVLWDLDGTLVDTEPYWIATEFALAEEHGATWSREHALELVGNDLVESGRYIREVMGLEMSAEDIVEYLLDGVVAHVEQEVPWRPGAVELLAELRAAGVPCGAGHDVLPAVRRADPRRAAARDLPGRSSPATRSSAASRTRRPT